MESFAVAAIKFHPEFLPSRPLQNQIGGRKFSAFFQVCATIVLEKLAGHRQLLLMTLDDTQRKKVAEWIAAGLKLSEIQNRLGSELGVRMTYMDVRLLVDDLKLTPKDVEPPKPPVPVIPPAAAGRAVPGAPSALPGQKSEVAPTPNGVSVAVDHLAKPGAVVSGKVTFSDGKMADWYIDQTGRLGLAPQQAGYRPPVGDVQQFQAALETELSRLGF